MTAAQPGAAAASQTGGSDTSGAATPIIIGTVLGGALAGIVAGVVAAVFVNRRREAKKPKEAWQDPASRVRCRAVYDTLLPAEGNLSLFLTAAVQLAHAARRRRFTAAVDRHMSPRLRLSA